MSYGILDQKVIVYDDAEKTDIVYATAYTAEQIHEVLAACHRDHPEAASTIRVVESQQARRRS